MITVIIINHNYGGFLQEAIESVLNQTYKNYEIIVIDGASTDNSRSLIFQYVQQYPEIITCVFKPTSGQAAAFNIGVRLAKGDIIAFLDADDYFINNKLERIAEIHKNHEFVGHGRLVRDINGEFIMVAACLDNMEKKRNLLRNYGYIYTYNLITSCISITRELAERIFPMPEENYVTFGDCYVKVMAQYYTNIKYVQEGLAFYRIHERQKTNSYENFEKLNAFVENLYERVFNDINHTLRSRKEELIPKLTSANLREALKLANPHITIKKGGRYVIYGAGNSSYKIKKCIEVSGGNISAVTDSDCSKWGIKWSGMEVVEPSWLIRHREEFDKIIIGSSMYYKEISDYLNSLGMGENMDYQMFTSVPND